MTTNNSINKTSDTFTTNLLTITNPTGADASLRIGKAGFPQYSILTTADGTSYYSDSTNAADVAFLRSAAGKMRISDATLTGSATLEINALTSFSGDLTVTPVGNLVVAAGHQFRANTINNVTNDGFVDFPNGVRSLTGTIQGDTGTFTAALNANSLVSISETGLTLNPGSNQTVTISNSGKLSIANDITLTGAKVAVDGATASGGIFFQGKASGDTNARAYLFSQGTNAGGLFVGAGNAATGAYIVYNASAGNFSFSQNSDKTGAATLGTHAGTIDALTYQNSSSAFTLDGTNLVLSGSTGIKFPTSGGTAAALSYYEESGTVSETWSGIWASALSGNITFTRIGNQVTLAFAFGADVATTAAHITADAALPTRLRPASSQVLFPIQLIDNGTNKFGFVAISTAGVIVIYAGPGVTNFFGSGTSGLSNRVSITYLV